MPTFLIFLALVLALTAVTLLILARRARAQTGLPAGRVVYNDAGPVLVPEKPFYDATLGLTGKPDYLVDTGGGVLVPVEVKSGWAPPEPREGHVLQALAYCALVERATGKRPPHALVRYRNRTFAIDYTAAAEAELLAALDELRGDDRRKELPRSHDEPARCAHCGYRDTCDERL